MFLRQCLKLGTVVQAGENVSRPIHSLKYPLTCQLLNRNNRPSTDSVFMRLCFYQQKTPTNGIKIFYFLIYKTVVKVVFYILRYDIIKSRYLTKIGGKIDCLYN